MPGRESLIRNPMSGRLIKSKGPVANKLREEGVILPKPERTRSKRKTPVPTGISKRAYLSRTRNLPVSHKRFRKGSKGWGKDKPESKGERDRLMEVCGPKCFLKPDTKSFPICQKLEGEGRKCKIDCRGLLAAKVRAAQWGYEDVKIAADEIGKRSNCKWSH